MKRKTLVAIILTLFVVVVAGLIGGYFYLTNTKTSLSTNPAGAGSLSGDLSTNNGPVIVVQSSSTEGKLPRLRQIATTPVAGYDFVDQGKGYVVWYVDRANGNVFQASTSSLEVTKITNTTIPKVYEAFIGKGGTNIILRVLGNDSETIQTFIGSPKNKTGTSTEDKTKNLVGVFIGEGIKEISLSSEKDRFLGITSSSLGQGLIYPFSGKPTALFSHPLKNWIPQWINANTAVLTSAPSAKTQNISFFLNIKTGILSKVLGPKNGLVVSSSPDASHLVFSENKNNTLSLGLLDIKTNSETSLSSQTIADKCVWSKQNPLVSYCGFPKSIPNGIYPDDWYQGKILFEDSIGTLNVKTSQINTVLDLKNESGVSIDATNLSLSKDDKYLLFTNKRDLTLWMLEL